MFRPSKCFARVHLSPECNFARCPAAARISGCWHQRLFASRGGHASPCPPLSIAIRESPYLICTHRTALPAVTDGLRSVNGNLIPSVELHPVSLYATIFITIRLHRPLGKGHLGRWREFHAALGRGPQLIESGGFFVLVQRTLANPAGLECFWLALCSTAFVILIFHGDHRALRRWPSPSLRRDG